jgi:hypothetical protein
MISDKEVRRALEAGRRVRPAILSARYLAESDSIELVTAWCKLTVRRDKIEYFRDVPASAMANLYASELGVHIDECDVDLNSAGLIEYITTQLMNDVSAAA